MKLSYEVGQDRSKTGYKAEHPNQLILYPVKQLIVAYRDDKNCLQRRKGGKNVRARRLKLMTSF